jgi:hypothetical protein
MTGEGYLGGLPPAQGEDMARVNAPGLGALREYLASGEAVAFLGAGVSAPLYPLWDGLIGDLAETAAATGRLGEKEAATCQALARESPEEVVEIVRGALGTAIYQEALRKVLRVRTDPESGRSWTPVHELVCRCAFQAVVTTNYDPGIVDARMRVRPRASATGFTVWDDELGLDRWRTGDVFGEAELPVLFAHGQHNRPDSVVLATTEYRRAYAGKLPHVLERLMDGHLVWIGFSFADQRIAAVLREIADRTGAKVEPGTAPRHVAVMAWDPAAGANDPGVLARRAEIAYGAQVVLYPARGRDHSALATLLSDLTDGRFPPAAELPPRSAPPPGPTPGAAPRGLTVRWVPEPEPVEHFTGRAEELARLDRWAADPQVALVGVSAWGGAGKTALVTHWVREARRTDRRAGVRGVFGWSFYADPSAENWARGLLAWAERDIGCRMSGTGRLAEAVLALLRAVPLLLVLDGLEVVQEGPAGDGFGRLLDGTLRELLVGACRQPHGGLVLLTSRFPFADLETFDGGPARMLEVPPFTPAEGSALLAAAGGDWLADEDRRALVRAVDGHALATGVLAGLLGARPRADVAALRAGLTAAARTDARVAHVLEFYAGRLGEPDRYLLAAVSLFARPVGPAVVLAVAEHAVFGLRLAGWTPGMVEAAVRDRLGGLASWHPDGTISAHPLVRDTFRPLVMDAADAAAETALAGLPSGKVTSRADALRVVEAIELLVDAGLWQAADSMYRARSGDRGDVWKNLPAARLGQRAASAFVATPARRDACEVHLGDQPLGVYITTVGLFAMTAADPATARDYLSMAIRDDRDTGDRRGLRIDLRNLAECLVFLGQLRPAHDAASESLSHAEADNDSDGGRDSHAYLGWLAGLAGNTAEAEQHFIAADQIEVTRSPGLHLYSGRGSWWAEWLARTGRPGPAETLNRRNCEISRRNRWNADVARCDRLLGRLALTGGDTAAAAEHLTTAAACFRDGDYLVELVTTLTDLAAYRRAAGDLDAAERHAAEAIAIAAPRGLVLAHSAGLAARARVRAAQAAATADRDLVFQGRDAADAALRLAVRHHLAWSELDALRAHAALDEAEHEDHGWAARADALEARLIPPGLDPDPLATVERLVAEQKAGQAEDAHAD